MPRLLFVALAFLGLSACASARGQVDFSALDHQLKDHATNVVDINLGKLSLWIASMVVDDHDPEDAALRDTLKGLKAVHIRHYEFNGDFEYPTAEIDAIRSQLASGGWSQLVKVRNRRDKDAADVFIGTDNDKITGLAILASEPREFTIVNVVGTVDIGSIEALRDKYSRHDRDESSSDNAARHL